MRDRTGPVDAPAGPLVAGEWLERNLEHPRVRVLDVRGRHPCSPLPHAKRDEYADRAHSRRGVRRLGARLRATARTRSRSRSPTPGRSRRARESWASATADLIVTYDDYYGIFAARVAWAFRYYGAESRVLDGGWRTWVEEGRPTSAAPDELPPARFRARPPRTAAAHACRGRRGPCAGRRVRRRPPAASVPRRAGRGEHRAHPGVAEPPLPGAGRRSHRAVGNIRRRSRDSRGTPGSTLSARRAELIATCGSGVSATVALMALERIGIHAEGVYDGSFNEWSRRPGAPGRVRQRDVTERTTTNSRDRMEEMTWPD